MHAGGGHAGADSTVKMITHEAAVHCCALKDMTTLWAAATFMFLEMPLNATAGPTSWWQQQRSVVLTQRAGLLFTRYPFLLYARSS